MLGRAFYSVCEEGLTEGSSFQNCVDFTAMFLQTAGATCSSQMRPWLSPLQFVITRCVRVCSGCLDRAVKGTWDMGQTEGRTKQ